tara:strand:- start:320 stop:715 length:396 start_codon:yes stop_codon:yes gene_type:complete
MDEYYPLKKLRQFTDLEIAENIQDPNGRFVYVFAEDAQLAVDELQTKLETAENDRNEWRDNAIISSQIKQDLEKQLTLLQEGIILRAIQKVLAMERLTFAECSDAEFIMDTLRQALTNTKNDKEVSESEQL